MSQFTVICDRYLGNYANNTHLGECVRDGRFHASRQIIEASCFWRAVTQALRVEPEEYNGVVFLHEHPKNGEKFRAYTNGSFDFVVEKLAD